MALLLTNNIMKKLLLILTMLCAIGASAMVINPPKTKKVRVVYAEILDGDVWKNALQYLDEHKNDVKLMNNDLLNRWLSLKNPKDLTVKGHIKEIQVRTGSGTFTGWMFAYFSKSKKMVDASYIR